MKRAYEKHNAFGTRLYWAYRDMIKRCYNPNHKNYNHYGARGIKVCERWLKSFENFKSDMGERPAGKTLDRKDNGGDYSPENCRWASSIEQGNNKRNNRFFPGTAKTLAQLARELKINPSTLWSRLKAAERHAED